MKLQINGKSIEISDSLPKLLPVLKSLGYPVTGVAIAVNFECIPRGEQDKIQLNENDEIEILSPHQGG